MPYEDRLSAALIVVSNENKSITVHINVTVMFTEYLVKDSG